MCLGSAYWGHFAPKNVEISTIGSIRSESRWQVPVRLGAQCLTQQRPTASGARPSVECFRRTDASAPPAESLPTPKFFCKSAFHRKAYPLYRDGTIFGQVFVRGGMIKISKWKVPPTGGQSRGGCSLTD